MIRLGGVCGGVGVGVGVGVGMGVGVGDGVAVGVAIFFCTLEKPLFFGPGPPRTLVKIFLFNLGLFSGV